MAEKDITSWVSEHFMKFIVGLAVFGIYGVVNKLDKVNDTLQTILTNQSAILQRVTQLEVSDRKQDTQIEFHQKEVVDFFKTYELKKRHN